MKRFIEFVHKEFLQIFRDTRTMLILLVMPLVLVLLFGYAITTEVKDTRVAVFDLSKSQKSQRIIQRLDANKYFHIEVTANNYDELQSLFRSNKIDMALCIDDDDNVQLLIDGMEPNQANMRSGYAMGVINVECSVLSVQLAAPSQFAQHSTLNTRFLYNPQSKSEYNFVPAIIGMIVMLLCTLMTSISIVREKETGTMEVLLASPLPPVYIIIAKLVPYFVISIANLTTILLLAVFVLGVPMAGSLLGFIALSLLYILVALALGLLISTCVNSQLAAMLLSLLTIVPTVYFSGMVFPIESMPEALQNIPRLIPARWFMDAARRLMIQGVEMHYVAKNFAVLALMLVVLLAVSLSLYKKRL
ncbi:MAG: ABC transporter permease [Prevotella sp.]|nr:ABC transporter permease [Prevotella sp.]